MESKNRTYLVDTQNLLPAECMKVKEILDISCWMSTPLTKKPYIFMAHTSYSVDEFATIQFPEGCIVTDITGQDLLAYC